MSIRDYVKYWTVRPAGISQTAELIRLTDDRVLVMLTGASLFEKAQHPFFDIVFS